MFLIISLNFKWSIIENKEKALVYVGVSVLSGLLLLILACAITICYKRRKTKSMTRNDTNLQAAKSTEFSTLMESSQTASGETPLFTYAIVLNG